MILQEYGTGLPAFPASSVARTAKVWRPAASDEKTAGLVHTRKSGPSREQLKVTPDSLARNENVAVSIGVFAAGFATIVTDGAVVSVDVGSVFSSALNATRS